MLLGARGGFLILTLKTCVEYRRFLLSGGQTRVEAPDPIRTPKLSTLGHTQYCGGGPRGNRVCCQFLEFGFKSHNARVQPPNARLPVRRRCLTVLGVVTITCDPSGDYAKCGIMLVEYP